MRSGFRALALAGGLVLPAAGGCSMQEDPRLSGIQAEVKALRRELAELKAALTPPVAGTPDIVADFSKPGRLSAIGGETQNMSRALQTDVAELKAKMARVDGLAKDVESLKMQMQKR